MKSLDLRELFVEVLSDMYDAENQILEALPVLIKLASAPELKEALKHHLKQTEEQFVRIEEIFDLLNEKPFNIPCEGVLGIIKETNEMLQNKVKSPVLDAAIISAAQKIEHYEIASYGTLRSFAKQLGFARDIINLLQDSLDEEAHADKVLTKLADGTLFTTGINRIAAEEEVIAKRRR